MRNQDHFLFYSAHVSATAVVLDREESRHAVSVLRATEGDMLSVSDGKGSLYRCRIQTISSEGCITEVVEKTAVPAPRPQLQLFIGLPERDAFEWALEGLVPLGVGRISPLVCRYCQKPWWTGKWEKFAERFEKKAIAAMKQSLSAWLPTIDEPVPFAAALDTMQSPLLLADAEGGPLRSLPPQLTAHERLSGLIGPPGGFSPDEVEALRTKESTPVQLASNRLTTELAAVVMAAGIAQLQLNQPA
jgi:16S rRNA (uracil1498-N3)-methyltransferase